MTDPNSIIGMSACGQFESGYNNVRFYGIIAKVDKNTITIRGGKFSRGKRKAKFYSFPMSRVTIYPKVQNA